MDEHLDSETLLGYPIYWVDRISGLIPDSVGVSTLATTRRISYVEQVAAMGLRFATMVHPTARISKRATLGKREKVVWSAPIPLYPQTVYWVIRCF